MPRAPQRWPRSRERVHRGRAEQVGHHLDDAAAGACSTSNNASNSAPSAGARRHRSTRTGRRRGTTWRDPTRPRPSPRASIAAMAAVSSSVAARVHASSPITTRRSMLCPTSPARLMPVPVALTDVAVAGVVGPRPRHRVVEEVARDVFDVGEEVGDVAAGRVGDGVEREAAVADEHRGDAVQEVGIDVRVPEHLRVGVAVRVDEPGRDDRARRVDLGLRRRPRGRDRPRRSRRRARARRPAAPAAPVPSMTSPPRIRISLSAMFVLHPSDGTTIGRVQRCGTRAVRW